MLSPKNQGPLLHSPRRRYDTEFRGLRLGTVGVDSDIFSVTKPVIESIFTMRIIFVGKIFACWMGGGTPPRYRELVSHRTKSPSFSKYASNNGGGSGGV